MKKRFLSVMAFALIAIGANAETIKYMTVEQKSGDKFDFLLADNPFITFNNGNLVVNGNQPTSFDISDVKNYHFTEKEVATSSNKLQATTVSIEVEDNSLLIKNAAAGTKVDLVNTSGVVLQTSTIDSHGSVIINLPVKRGIYIITIGRESFKVVRN